MTSKIDSTSDEARAAWLLMWAREKGIAISELQVGGVRIVCTDVQLIGGQRVRTPDERDPDSLYRQFGGDLIDKVRRDLESTYEDDDEDEDGDTAPPPPPRRVPPRRPRRG